MLTNITQVGRNKVFLERISTAAEISLLVGRKLVLRHYYTDHVAQFREVYGLEEEVKLRILIAVAVVAGHNDDSKCLWVKGIQYFETISARHFDVQENQVWFYMLDKLDGGENLTGLTDDFDILDVIGKHMYQQFPAVLFVIYDNSFYHFGVSSKKVF